VRRGGGVGAESVLPDRHLRHEDPEERSDAPAMSPLASNMVGFRDAGIVIGSGLSWHRLGPLDVPFEAKRSRGGAVAISEVSVCGLVASGPGQ
jgi:hypothetical protein